MHRYRPITIASLAIGRGFGDGFAAANPYMRYFRDMHNDRPNRQSTRLKGYDYAGPGSYFVTICTRDRRYFFGDVRDADMHLSLFGQIAAREWQISIDRRPHIIPHAFIVMPNHVHGLISLDPKTMPDSDREEIARGLPPGSLGALLNRYKGAVTTPIRDILRRPKFKVWQSNYHDRIVRNEREFDTIFTYILDNPARWEEDRFNLKNM
jgi:REP element-mobilizing transposase RayT